eukprot:349932-Chlamydomonas_euryale.AAC.2
MDRSHRPSTCCASIPPTANTRPPFSHTVLPNSPHLVVRQQAMCRALLRKRSVKNVQRGVIGTPVILAFHVMHEVAERKPHRIAVIVGPNLCTDSSQHRRDTWSEVVTHGRKL